MVKRKSIHIITLPIPLKRNEILFYPMQRNVSEWYEAVRLRGDVLIRDVVSSGRLLRLICSKKHDSPFSAGKSFPPVNWGALESLCLVAMLVRRNFHMFRSPTRTWLVLFLRHVQTIIGVISGRNKVLYGTMRFTLTLIASDTPWFSGI